MDRMNMSSTILPAGFRFHPTDQELIIYYLEKKIASSTSPELSIIADVNIYKYNPWELPRMALFGEHEWFFFSPRDRKYPNGSRPNRAAASGYWKATGTDKPILTSNGSQCLGVKKALVFYKGRPPKGIKTSWMMLEYRLLDDTHQLHRLRGSMRLDDWVLCRVRQKSSSPQQKEDNYDSSCGSSSPFALGRLGQEGMLKDDDALKDYDYDIQASLMAPLEGNVEADQDQQIQVEFQQGSPGYSVSPVNSNSLNAPASSFKEALDSLTKVISMGTFEEPAQPPKKRQYSHTSAPNNTDTTSIFQVSSLAIPASFPRSFSEFLI